MTIPMDKADTEKLILALKVLGNAGHPGSIKPLIKFLPGCSTVDPRVPQRVHIEAVMALRNIAKKEPKKVSVHSHEHTQDLFSKVQFLLLHILYIRSRA